MPRPKTLKPKYCHHKRSGRAFVLLNGEFVYLGRYDSQESRDAYDRVIGEWITRGRLSTPAVAASSPDGTPTPGLTVSTLVHSFWEFAKTYYANPDGTPSREADNFRLALRPLRRLYGPTPAAEFGPLKLKALRAHMLQPQTYTHPKTKKTRTRPGWSRTYANRQVARIKQVFKYATENELVPPSVYHGLVTVKGLRKGHGPARETAPVRPVPDEHVDAVIAALSPSLAALITLQHQARAVGRFSESESQQAQRLADCVPGESYVAAMVQVQRLTGMRSSEVCIMRGCDVDTSGALWVYRPAHHKTAHLDHEREVYVNKQAQQVLTPFLKPDLQAFLFSPAEAEASRRARRREGRKTPVQPSQVLRAESAASRNRRRAPGDQYTRESYRKAVARACKKAGVPAFFPHRLRHLFATKMRKSHGIEVTRILLSHKSPAMTLVYAEADRQKAAAAVSEVG